MFIKIVLLASIVVAGCGPSNTHQICSDSASVTNSSGANLLTGTTYCSAYSPPSLITSTFKNSPAISLSVQIPASRGKFNCSDANPPTVQLHGALSADGTAHTYGAGGDSGSQIPGTDCSINVDLTSGNQATGVITANVAACTKPSGICASDEYDVLTLSDSFSTSS